MWSWPGEKQEFLIWLHQSFVACVRSTRNISPSFSFSFWQPGASARAHGAQSDSSPRRCRPRGRRPSPRLPAKSARIPITTTAAAMLSLSHWFPAQSHARPAGAIPLGPVSPSPAQEQGWVLCGHDQSIRDWFEREIAGERARTAGEERRSHVCLYVQTGSSLETKMQKTREMHSRPGRAEGDQP